MKGPPTPGAAGWEGGARPELKVTSRPNVHPRAEVWPRPAQVEGSTEQGTLGKDEGQAHRPHGRSSPGTPSFIKRPRGPPALASGAPTVTEDAGHVALEQHVNDELGHHLPAQNQGEAGGPEVATHEGEVNHVPGEGQRAAACARAPLAGSRVAPTFCGRPLLKHLSQQAPRHVPSRRDPALAPAWTPPSIM